MDRDLKDTINKNQKPYSPKLGTEVKRMWSLFHHRNPSIAPGLNSKTSKTRLLAPARTRLTCKQLSTASCCHLTVVWTASYRSMFLKWQLAHQLFTLMLQKFELIHSCVTHLQWCFNFDKVKGCVLCCACLFCLGYLGFFFKLKVSWSLYHICQMGWLGQGENETCKSPRTLFFLLWLDLTRLIWLDCFSSCNVLTSRGAGRQLFLLLHSSY